MAEGKYIGIKRNEMNSQRKKVWMKKTLFGPYTVWKFPVPTLNQNAPHDVTHNSFKYAKNDHVQPLTNRVYS